MKQIILFSIILQMLIGCSYYKEVHVDRFENKRTFTPNNPNIFRRSYLGNPGIKLIKNDDFYEMTYEYEFRKGSSVSHNYMFKHTLKAVSTMLGNLESNVDVEPYWNIIFRGKYSEMYFREEKPILRYYDFGAYKIVEIELIQQ